MRRILLSIALICYSTYITAQCSEIYDSRIATLQVVANDNWLSLPVINLNSNDRINIDFDDLTHQYTRYTYKLEHCEADWSVSDNLFPSDYIDGFAEGNTIDNSHESINTNIQYTHYTLQIPNNLCRPKISGNYRLTVYDENDDNKPVFSACFMIAEPVMGIQLEVTSNTDIDINNSHQQVSMQLTYGNTKVTDYRAQITTVLMQNGRIDNIRKNVKPQYIMPDGLKWQHCKDFIFDGGNEYHKYEILDVSHTTMGLDDIIWDGKNYQAYPFMDEPRPNYVHDEDADGAFYIRNSDNIENNITCDYVYVNYRMKCPQIKEAEIYINGVWTNNSFTPQYKMTYNEEKEMYEAAVLQKQGYYNYQYLMKTRDGRIKALPYDGSYYQTENRYQALVYYRGQGERTDKLVGYQEIQTSR